MREEALWWLVLEGPGGNPLCAESSERSALGQVCLLGGELLGFFFFSFFSGKPVYQHFADGWVFMLTAFLATLCGKPWLVSMGGAVCYAQQMSPEN